MVVVVTCKNEEDPIKNVDARVVTTLSINFKMLKESLLYNRKWGLDEIQTNPSYMVVLLIFKEVEDQF